MGNTTSSITTVVPTRRTAPTAGKSPLRTSHSFSYSAFRSVKTIGRTVGIPASIPAASSICLARAAASPARVSTRSAVASSPRDARYSGIPSLPSTERSDARSISSTAETGPALRRVVARHALPMSGKIIRADALWACSSTVRYVISAMNPSVPSEPIIRCRRMSTGSSWSTKALIP